MKALTAAEMHEVDRLTTERHGIPSLQLMENAGKSVFDCIRSFHGDTAASHASVLCGKGNNGGDGLVVARLLQESGLQPCVYLFADPQSLRGDAAENFLRLKKSGVDIRIIPDPDGWHATRGELAKSRVIVDALLGTGLKSRVEGFLASVITDVNTIRATPLPSAPMPSWRWIRRQVYLRMANPQQVRLSALTPRSRLPRRSSASSFRKMLTPAESSSSARSVAS